MPKRYSKNYWLDIAEPFITMAIIALPLLWLSNKMAFWRWLIILIMVLGLVLVILLLRHRAQIHKNSQWKTDNELIYWLRGLKPGEFEDYIAELFRKLGYQTEKVGQTNDHGIDVTLKKDGQTSYVQCKKFITTIVSSPAMRDFYGAIVDHLTNGKAYFVTTNVFTLDAELFAENKPIELVDRFKLVKYIRMTENQKSETKAI